MCIFFIYMFCFCCCFLSFISCVFFFCILLSHVSVKFHFVELTMTSSSVYFFFAVIAAPSRTHQTCMKWQTIVCARRLSSPNCSIHVSLVACMFGTVSNRLWDFGKKITRNYEIELVVRQKPEAQLQLQGYH